MRKKHASQYANFGSLQGKAYRLVIQRQKRIDGELDLWEGEYTYRCILTNDYESSEK